MPHETRARRRRVVGALGVIAALTVAIPITVAAGQRAPRGQGVATPVTGPAAEGSPRALAPLDLEGTWVSVVTEDWRWRMMTPAKGDAQGVPLSLEGRKMADSWNLDKDNASGNQCKAYGAGGIVRIPGRARVAWDDDFTLRFEFDAGRQVRLLRFPSGLVQPAGGVPALQGHSVANWQFRNTGVPILNEETAQRRGRAGGRGPARAAKGSLKVVTTGMLPGYFRKNGLAYSGDARLTEYIDRHEDYGSQWFTVLSVLDDPRYLVSPFVTTTHFKREADASKWNPQPCETLTPIAPLPQGEN